MLKTSTILLALMLSLQVPSAAAAQNGAALASRIADTIKEYEAGWKLKSSATYPHTETLRKEPLYFHWTRHGTQYVFAFVYLHTTEEDAARTLQHTCSDERRRGEVSPSDVKWTGGETYEWKGTGIYENAHGYYFRKGKVVVTINSSSKSTAERFATLIAEQL